MIQMTIFDEVEAEDVFDDTETVRQLMDRQRAELDELPIITIPRTGLLSDFLESIGYRIEDVSFGLLVSCGAGELCLKKDQDRILKVRERHARELRRAREREDFDRDFRAYANGLLAGTGVEL